MAQDIDLSSLKGQNVQCESDLDYHQLIGYMKELRAFFRKAYDGYFMLGSVYQGNPDFSYFSLKVEELKRHKLKFVVVLNHKTLGFSICLSGQNKSIRKKYWNTFKGSDFKNYHLAESIDASLSILDHPIVECSDFEDRAALTEQIETESLRFVEEIVGVLVG